MKTTITKEFQWDCAHRLYSPKLTRAENKEAYGLCYNIHGHTYKLFVTVSSELDILENGMVMNFKNLKKIVKELIVDDVDHSLVLTEGDPLIKDLSEHPLRINIVPYESTCENQIVDYWKDLDVQLRLNGIILEKLKLYETPTSFATLTR